MSSTTKSSAMKGRAAIASALLALTLALPGGLPRAADVGGGCGGNWHGSAPKVCTFNFRGFPIMVFADARVSSGTAKAHIWVTVEGFDGNVIYECSASASGYAKCDQGMGDLGETLDERWATFHLRCHVDGTAASAFPNYYYCKSAHGF